MSEQETSRGALEIGLPIHPTVAGGIRPSHMSRRRAISLALVHLVIIAHIAHWLITGRTVSPVEPSEAMYTLNNGYLNAGFLFFAVSLAATLVLGRFVCGWACHLIAYQDLCAWLLKRIGIKPKPFRSRILVFAPLALAIYMFAWPTAYRLWVGVAAPTVTNHLMKTDFWETFPGWGIAVLTVVVCGFAIVYFLGSKGFCTYACPYGGFFAVADRAAVGRIRVTDACLHCGHCTATCTSNVRVGEEVATFGMVVDPGCMKCMDCVSVCPNDALYFGWGAPAFATKAKTTRRPKHYDFSLNEELLMVVVGVAALFSLRGLYGQIPLLLAMGVAAMTAFVFMKLVRLIFTADVRWQNLQLSRGRRWTGAGAAFAVTVGLHLAFTVHSGVVQYHMWRGHSLFWSLALGDDVWLEGDAWSTGASKEDKLRADAAIAHLEQANHLGVITTPSAEQDLIWLYLARGRTEPAEAAARRLIAVAPDRPQPYRGLAGVMRKTGRYEEAERFYRKSLAVDPTFGPARDDLVAMFASTGRIDEAIVLLEQALAVDESSAVAQYALGYALLSNRRTDDALPYLRRAAILAPDVALYQYNLSVGLFMSGRPAEAEAPVRAAIRLDPGDAQAYGFLSVVLRELGDTDGANAAAQKAIELRDAP